MFKTLIHPSIQSITKSIVQIISSTGSWNPIPTPVVMDERSVFCKKLLENLKELVESIKAKSGIRLNNKAEEFLCSIVTGLCGNNVTRGANNSILKDTSGMSSKTVMRRMKACEKYRENILKHSDKAYKIKVSCNR